jgi:hypothetical protein
MIIQDPLTITLQGSKIHCKVLLTSSKPNDMGMREREREREGLGEIDLSMKMLTIYT